MCLRRLHLPRRLSSTCAGWDARPRRFHSVCNRRFANLVVRSRGGAEEGDRMAIIGASQFLERLTFFNGQRLFADDLQTLESFNREMRWLHNQSLHQPGVGSGYAVTGAKGDRQVTVTPGYALDACGREIVLT